MSSNTQYEAVATATTTTAHTGSGRCSSCLECVIGFLIALSIVLSVPFIVFYALEYNKRASIQPSYCRVNAIGTELGTKLRVRGSVFPFWNVDVVKQTQNNSTEKNIVVLRSSLIIRGPEDDVRSPSSVLEYAKQLYSVSCCDHI